MPVLAFGGVIYSKIDHVGFLDSCSGDYGEYRLLVVTPCILVEVQLLNG
jgi:hypothetical protein